MEINFKDVKRYYKIIVPFLLMALLISFWSIRGAIQFNTGTTVEKWLGTFMSKDFDKCDEYIDSECNDGLRINKSLSQTSQMLYYIVYERAVDAISYTQVQSKVLNIEDSTTSYQVEVKYKPYDDFGEIEFDTKGYLSLCESFVDGKISEEEYKQRVVDLCVNCFRNEFKQSKGTQSKTFTIIEKEVDGTAVICNADEFMNSLLTDTNILTNLEFYTSDVNAKVKDVINRI